MGLKERLLKNSSIKETAVLEASKIFEPKEVIDTGVILFNVALNGKTGWKEKNGGMTPGIVQIAAESRHFKSKFGLILALAFLEMFPDGVVLFADNEFGTPESYFDKFIEAGYGDRVIHTPILDVGQMKHELTSQVDIVEDKEKLFILVDSIGNMASKREIESALKSDDQPADLKRAQDFASFFRIITPRLNLKGIYMVVINHTYQTLEMFSKQVAKGGSGSIYNSNVIIMISKAKETEGSGVNKELLGYRFTLKMDKSRYIKPESKLPIVVTFDEGVSRWSGLFDLAEEAGYIKAVSAQKYEVAYMPGNSFKRKEVENDDVFWTNLLNETDFTTWIENSLEIKE